MTPDKQKRIEAIAASILQNVPVEPSELLSLYTAAESEVNVELARTGKTMLVWEELEKAKIEAFEQLLHKMKAAWDNGDDWPDTMKRAARGTLK